PDTVRQDMRVLKYHGSPNAGYQVAELLEHLQRYLHVTAKNRVAIVGLGNLGKALLRYYKNKESFFSLEAAFELDESVVGRMILGTPCYHTSEITKIVEEKNITVGIIAVPATASQKVVDALVMGGVRGILMFTDMLVKVPEHVFVEYVDMTTLLETTIFFSRLS
ncbi:MAG TPA: redox-sensing transcriptional repressor Rex, partial [bacterium]|nr:redox-sensing transcriptional repressor Rex [bacterium]